MTKSAQEALEKINATQKSIADKAEEITKSVEDANDKEEKAEKSEQPEQKECDDKEAKKSEVEDKKDDKEEDKEEKSESKESTGKLEHEKAPEKDPAAKSEDKGEVEKSMVSVKPLGEDKTEKSITDDSGISKKDFINVVSKSINNYEDANNVINYSDSISLLKSLKEKASEADYISNDMVEEYEKA